MAETYNIYLPTYEDGVLVGVELVETFEIGPSGEKPPLGARMQELEFLTGTAHLSEPAEAKGSIAASATKGRQVVDDAAAAQAIAQEAAAKARIAQLLDPEGVAKAQAVEAIEREHAELSALASTEEIMTLDEIKGARLAALEA